MLAAPPRGVRGWLRNAAVEGAVRVLRPIRRRAQGRLRPETLRRMLVLQLQNVGDTMIFSPALQALRRRYPRARIDLLGTAVSAQIYKRCPLVDRIWVTSKTASGMPPRSLIRQLRAERYDCVIADVTQVSLRYGAIAALVGARASVGFDLAGRGVLFTHPVTAPPELSFVESNLRLAQALDADPSGIAERFYFAGEDVAHADRLLADAGLGNRPFVAVHPASNWQSKTWYPERWAQLADALGENYGLDIVFVGTASESAYVESIRASMRMDSVVLNGETDLPQLGALLDRARLFVGTDSGPRHIAGALGRPQVTLMSSQDFAHRWGLERPNEIVLRTDPDCAGCLLSVCGHRRCMDLIAVEQVLDACRTLLSRADEAMHCAPPDSVAFDSPRI